MTIYEVVLEFFESLFPALVYADWLEEIEALSFFLTIFIVFGLILIPLWKIATLLLRGAKKW